MEKKEDRRIAMTKRLLKAALIELLKDRTYTTFPFGSFVKEPT